MALLSEEKRKKYFDALGLGEYNEANIRKLQKKYLRKQDVDGIYGTDTDRLLRHVYNVTKYTKNFKPEEFKCECGGKYCTGYPSYMKKVELQNLQKIRDHFKKPMTVTCGLRCRPYNNSLAGSIPNSKHLTGYATDFYMQGVTDTLKNRKASIKWIKKLPNHNYTYGDGINSNGYRVSALYMGNALHTDTSAPKKEDIPDWVKRANAWAEKMADDQKAGYRKWNSNDKSTHECLLCHPETDPKHKWYKRTWNCIGESTAYLHHGGGIDCACSCHVFDDAFMTKLLKMDKDEAEKQIRKKLKNKHFDLIRNGGKPIPLSMLKPGDLCIMYDRRGKATHIYPYIGNGYMIDCGNWAKKSKQIQKRKAGKRYVAIRYTGK